MIDASARDAPPPDPAESGFLDTGASPIEGHSVDIELDLPADQARRVFRHAAITAHRRGRTRTAETVITWHDPPAGVGDGTLLVHGGEAGWTLQRTIRRDGWPVGLETWPAAVPNGSDAAPPRAVAALHGRTRRVSLAPDGDEAPSLAVTLLEGSLRNVSEERPCCRVRVHGEARAAARLARRLGETLPLLPCALSLDELAGAMARTAVPGGAPPDPPVAAVSADGDVDAALAAVFGTLSAALLCALARLERPDAAGEIDPRAVHGARVATRRLRSALAVFREPLGGSLDALRDPLGALGRTLGRLRDWDVFLHETGAAVAAALGGDAAGQARLASLLAEAERRREAARAEVRRALTRPATRRLLLHLSLLSALRPWREASADAAADAAPLARPIDALAPHLLDRRFRRLVSVGKHLDGLDGAALHELRKKAKTLRYALELLGPTQPRRDARRLLKRLAALQDGLGALHDAETANALMRAAVRPGGPHAWASGVVAGWQAARAASARAALAETWRAVRHTDRFWRA